MKIKIKDLRQKNKQDLQKQLDELKTVLYAFVKECQVLPSRHQLINGLLDDGFSSAGISGRKSELGGLVQFLNMQNKANNQNERVSVLIVVHGFLLAHKASESPYI